MKYPNIPTSPLGQWKYPKQIVRVPGNNITMQGIDHPNIGIADTGERKLMMPGQNYTFPGAKSVVEVPVKPKAQNGFVKEMVKGGKSASDENLLNIPFPLSKRQSDIFRRQTEYSVPGHWDMSGVDKDVIPSKENNPKYDEMAENIKMADLFNTYNAGRFVYGNHIGTGADWRQPDHRFKKEQEAMKYFMSQEMEEGFHPDVPIWQQQGVARDNALKSTRRLFSEKIDPILNTAWHEIGLSPDVRSMQIGGDPFDKTPTNLVREYNYVVDYDKADKYKLGSKDERDYFTSYYETVEGMSKEDANKKADELINKAEKIGGFENMFKKERYIGAYKYGGEVKPKGKYGTQGKGTLVEVEGNEIGVVNEGGEWKKLFQTPASTPSHDEGGKDVVLPANKHSMIFPRKYLGVINDALKRGDNATIARYGQQMKAESEAAGAMGLPYSNPPKAQEGRDNDEQAIIDSLDRVWDRNVAEFENDVESRNMSDGFIDTFIGRDEFNKRLEKSNRSIPLPNLAYPFLGTANLKNKHLFRATGYGFDDVKEGMSSGYNWLKSKFPNPFK